VPDQGLNKLAAIASWISSLTRTGRRTRCPRGAPPRTVQTGAFQVIRTVLEMRAKFLVHLGVHLRALEKCGDCRSAANPRVSYFLRLRGERRSNGGRKPVPVVSLFPQALAARGGKFIKLGAAIVL